MQNSNQLVIRRPDIVALTGLRFVAAFGIMYAHTINFALRGQADGIIREGILISLTHTAQLSMTLFFVLSGFVIHYNYAQTLRNEGWLGVRQFLIARAARLYPLYLLCLSIDISQNLSPGHVSQPFYVYLSYLTLTQNWLPFTSADGQPFWSIFVVGAWSISAEIFLYLIYIPIVKICSFYKMKSKNLIIKFSISIFFVYSFLWIKELDGVSYIDLYHSPLARLPEFIIGAICARIVTSKPEGDYLRRRYHYLGVIGVALCIVGIVFTIFNPQIGDVITRSWGYAVPVAFIILRVTTCDDCSYITRILSKRLLVALGEASYSIYLLHGYLNYLFSGFTSWHSFVFKISTTWMTDLIIAVGVYRVYEIPTRAWIRRVLGGQKVTAD